MSPKRSGHNRQHSTGGSKTVTIGATAAAVGAAAIAPTAKREKRTAAAMSVVNTYEQARNNIENWEFHFKLADLDTIKSIIRCKDLNGVPLIIGAVVLNQKDTLTALMKHNYNLNEPDKNNMTPLVWSVKLKHLDMVQFLFAHHADVTIKPHNGDDIVCMALGNTLWDEESFLLLFNHLKITGYVDVNAINKNGLSLLHLAVRREWNFLVDVLILNDVNVNITTQNGVTPLMLASYRNDSDIVARLLARGASVKRRNADGFTALCYAFSSAMTKELEAPFKVIDALQAEMLRVRVDTCAYMKERLKLIGASFKCRHSDQPNPELMLQQIFTFFMLHAERPFALLAADLHVGRIVCDLLVKHQQQETERDAVKLPLMLLNTIFSNACLEKEEDQRLVCDEFVHVGCFDECLRIIRAFKEDTFLMHCAMSPIIVGICAYPWAQEWFEGIKNEFAMLLPKYEKSINVMEHSSLQLSLLKRSVEDFKEHLYNIPRCIHEKEPLEKVLEVKIVSKKTKRRTKALKAKIAKLKTAEMTERINLQVIQQTESSVKLVPDEETQSTADTTVDLVEDAGDNAPLPDIDLPDMLEMVEAVTLSDEENMRLTAVTMALMLLDEDYDLDFDEPPKCATRIQQTPTTPPRKSGARMRPAATAASAAVIDNDDWVQAIRSLPFHNCITKMYKPQPMAFDGGASKCEMADVDIIIKYLEGLMGIIVNKYKDAWARDRPPTEMYDDELSTPRELVDGGETPQQRMEKSYLRKVHRDFYALTRHVKEAYEIDAEACFKVLKELERLLLLHSIRGETSVESVAEMEVVKLRVTMPADAEPLLTAHMEQVMAGEAGDLQDVEIVFKEHVSAQKQLDANSMGDYVYMNEIAHLPMRRCMCNDIPAPLSPHAMAVWEEQCNRSATSSVEALDRSAATADVKDSKWTALIRSLELMTDAQMLFKGSIRISNLEKRKSHVLSLNGNYTVLEIGLTSDNKPLAVKILAKSDPYAILLRNQVDPLLELRHKHVLPYHTCAFDGNLLVLATPLMEFNLGQYVLKMREPQSHICKLNVIKQLLSGLMFLHNHDEPIVHGNLKPSNVLIDIHGMVKLAEFGIHKAMLKTKNLPDSSVIWFATELYKLYKQQLPLDCTCASDVQVAGMLVHFAINCGTHPFGKDVPDILKNLEEGSADITSYDMELYDLLNWMLLGDAGDRPSIHQVMSHIFFWSKQKKWAYVLVCAGLGPMSTIPMDIEKLHASLDRIAAKEHIAGNGWVVTARRRFPEVAVTLRNVADTPSGLLRFVKDVAERKLVLSTALCDPDKDFSAFILGAFPHFVLSLYRMIENTVWSDHRVFMPFHNVVEL